MRDKKLAGFTDDELLEHLPALRAFARRFYPSSTDVDDLVQDTLAKAMTHSQKFQPGTRLRSWLFTIMRNTFYTKYKFSKREQVGLSDDYALSASVPPTQEWTIRGKELEAAFADMPDNHRIAVDLIFIEGVSYETASQRCGCPIGTIKSRVNRARVQLIKALEDGANRSQN